MHLTRDRIPIQSVVAAFVTEDSVGYIKAIRFAANTAQEFEEAMALLQAQGAKSVVVDLRGNGGGYLNAVVDMVELFLDEGDPIVYTEGKSSPPHVQDPPSGSIFGLARGGVGGRGFGLGQ